MNPYSLQNQVIISSNCLCCSSSFYSVGVDFPKELPSVIKRMFGQMFRLFAHIYHEHYDKVLSLNEEPHFNSLFAHFISFAKEFDLLEKKELQPLSELVDTMSKNGVIS
jgi:hypothetical protein